MAPSRMTRRRFLAASALAAGGVAYGSYRLATREPGPSVLGLQVWAGDVDLPEGLTIAAGDTVTLNPSVDTTLTLGANLIVAGDLVSHPEPGVTHLIRFTGINEAGEVGGGDVPVASDVGLWVVDGGRLDLAGAAKTAWGRAVGSLAAGAATLELDRDPIGWMLGDEVVVTPTQTPNVAGFDTRFEVRTVASIAGRTIGFTPLAYPHPAVTVAPGQTLGAEVLNLTRNMRIEGEPAGRAHVWIKSTAAQTIRHAQIRHVAPQKGTPAASVLGRYGLHFHRCGDGSRDSLVEGVVVRDAGGHAFAPHRSHGVTLRDCVSYETQEDAYWYDMSPPFGRDGYATEAPKDLLYERCVAAKVTKMPAGNGYRMTGFWLGGGTGNSCIGCVAVGILGTVGAAGYHWPEGEVGVWTMADCLAHNCPTDGIFTWQNGPEHHDVDRFTAYHCGRAGIEHGAYDNSYSYRDCVLYGCKIAGLALHGENKPPPVQPCSFERMLIDGAGITPNAVRLEKPNIVNRPPSIMCAPTFVGITGVPYLIAYTGEDSTIAERLSIQATCS